ncbi:MAG: glycosyltransferase family 39 protein [Candidatus Krumholzibacteria bacterium]|nr:glycosyltransferase family 39 protein [Candidatus Krumholzibacteria bacterium]
MKQKTTTHASNGPSGSRWTRLAAHPKSIYGVAGLYGVVLIYVGLKFHVMGDGESETDFFGQYVLQARAFLGGDVLIDPYRGPLYPLIVALLHMLLRPLGAGLFESAIVLSAVCAAVVLFFAHRALRMLFDPALAAVATVLVVANPVFFRYSYTTGNDMFFAALATATVYLVLKSRQPGTAPVIGTGVLAALTYLTRYNGIAVILAACVCVWVVKVWGGRLKKRTLVTVGLVATFALAIAPWGFYTLSQRGTFFYNKNYVNVAVTFYGEGQQTDHFLAENPDRFNNLADVVSYNPAQFLAKIPAQAWTHVVESMERVMLWPSAVWIGLGIVFLSIRRPSRRQVAYYTFAALFFAVLWLVFFSYRFYLFLIPSFLSLVVVGMRGVCDLLPGQSHRRLLFGVLVSLLIAYSAYESVAYNREHVAGGTYSYRERAETFIGAFPQARGKRIAARKPYFAYFAGMQPVTLPVVDSEEELIAYLQQNNVHYLLLTRVAMRTRPQIHSLFDYQADHPGLEPVAVSEIGVLYRVEEDTGVP